MNRGYLRFYWGETRWEWEKIDGEYDIIGTGVLDALPGAQARDLMSIYSRDHSSEPGEIIVVEWYEEEATWYRRGVSCDEVVEVSDEETLFPISP